MQEPLVSILMPFKNTEDFLQECLQSVKNQFYSNWQLIAVNDHSTDNSKLILEKNASEDSRIKVFENEGQGIIDALQKAYKESNGQLITRMDSDDIMTPDKIQVMATSLLKRGNGHLAIGQVKYFSDQGISNGYDRYQKWLNRLTAKGENYSEIYKECVIPSPCWMVFREDFDLCDGFNPNVYPEDYDLAFRFYENKFKCIPCEQVIHHWRDYDYRTSRTSEHYAQNYFLDIKLHYFIKLEYDKNRPLIIWGAGNKGKTIAKKLIESNIDFFWLCDNPKKIGKDIYGKTMLHFSKLSELVHPQSIITVANDDEQERIRSYFSRLGQKHMSEYYFFC
ncbi:glycosyltransferase [Aurantibacter crassamenti]|uniref:glycosyltransferase n=1 Tax=Aurantibacter crassamenti TaxID=1837375 RepID=UPI00193AC921|nr:glycosyltransferase [Aurantibacter crassamenti]MBM1107368.1 glycosyltransferase [Aurantibacter crassamenti]